MATNVSYSYAEEVKTHSHGAEVGVNGLNLNNGKPWDMDEHTRTMSAKMEQTFSEADHSTQKSLNALGRELQSQTNVLINGCKMEGKAHDQLHAFLGSHLPAIAALIDAKDYESAKESAIALKGQFQTYQKYFK